jgi:transcriptional regulator GlxA family with amidase domain
VERTRNVAVLVYEKVDGLDFVGPFDVFATASNWGKDFRVYTVSEKVQPLNTISGFTFYPKYSFDDCPPPDILIVPGGLGSRAEMNNESLTSWINNAANTAELVLSVCTGALLLAKANLLEGLSITTNRRALDLLRQVAPINSKILEDVRYIDNGKIIMSAGVTAGIDASLYVVSKLLGLERAADTASRLEYEWNN